MIIKLKANSIVCHPALKISAMCIFSINHNKIIFYFETVTQKLSIVSGDQDKEQNYQHVSTKV